MRISRSLRAAVTGTSPRALSESAVSYPRPPRTWIESSIRLHPTSVLNSFEMAASSRMSNSPRSTIIEVSSATASIANVFAAIEAR